MELTSHFNDMLTEIRPPQELLEECATAHTELREFLMNVPELKDIAVTTFLQGSYRRSTLIRPTEGAKADVDVVIVTNLDPQAWTPTGVQDAFCRVLDKHPTYRGNHERQGRSIGLSSGSVNLDLVVTAAPSETLKALLESEVFGGGLSVEANPAWELRQWQQAQGKDWRADPLLIPDRDANRWVETDPLSQIDWTHDKNRRTNGHYVNVVKAVKWWWAQHSSGRRGVPKGYLVERITGLHCPDGIESVAEGFSESLEGIQGAYGEEVRLGSTPFIPDIGIPSNDVFRRVPPDCFREFYTAVNTCAAQAREAFADPSLDSSARKWAAIFGSVFPIPATRSGPQGFHRPKRPAAPEKARFA